MGFLANKEMREFIDVNDIKDLRTLLKLLDYPDIEYQVFWYTRLIEAKETLYIEDYEFFFTSYSYDGYEDLNKFEENYYIIEFSKWDLICYDREKHLLYYYEIKYEGNTQITELDPNLTYYSYEQLMKLIGLNEF